MFVHVFKNFIIIVQTFCYIVKNVIKTNDGLLSVHFKSQTRATNFRRLQHESVHVHGEYINCKLENIYFLVAEKPHDYCLGLNSQY